MTTPLLLSCQAVCKSFGSRDLFKNLSLSVFSDDRVGLIGPNGSGKSTLLKILAGIEKLDKGTLSLKKGLKIGYVPQSCEFLDIEPKQVLLEAIKDVLDKEDYEKEYLAEMWLSKLGFTGEETSAAKLSGGWKKRLSLAEQLIREPDLLLLDEPTNHLDVEGILWLEKFLLREVQGYLLVSHDRYFLQNVTNRIMEINAAYPSGMFGIDGPYQQFLEKKEEFLQGQLQYERSLATDVRKETKWLSRSPKARTTKSKSRIDEAHDLLQEYSQVQTRNTQKTTTLNFSSSDRQTRKLVVAKNLAKQINKRSLFQGLDFTLSPGVRMGLMGPNGSGKTTLLKLMTGDLHPDEGTLKQADDLKVVYFDQHRSKLPDNISLREALSPQGDYVVFRGQSIHVNGWCKRFLFSPDILDMPIGKLSGGERARISIAHLMLQSADLLLLDEPTNDLDIPTLEALEESLMEFPGAVVLITHDRCMLDRICNVFLALGDPNNTELYADYQQWQASCKPNAPQVKEKKKEQTQPKLKLSYTEKQEYDQMEGKIGKLEAEVQALNHLLEKTEVAKDSQKLSEVCKAISIVETQIEKLYLRWDELQKKQSS